MDFLKRGSYESWTFKCVLTDHKHRSKECSHIQHSILKFTETEEDFKVTAECHISYLYEVPIQSCSQQKWDAESSHICAWYSKQD